MSKGNRKKRILWMGEFSILHTGYAKYSRELLSRLYQTGKYEIAEVGCYGHEDDQRKSQLPWLFYGNLPTNKEEEGPYNNVPSNQFGEWRFNDVCLDFKPDVVIDIRDPWMCAFETTSPFRPFYHLLFMPTIDSAPQTEYALSLFQEADGLLAYTDYGREVIEGQTHKNLKVLDLAPAGIDPLVYKPTPNKRQHKSNMGLDPDTNIIGTVMRNQRRKLYPDLFVHFRKFLDTHPELGKKTYLYVHTSFPDIGWDIPKLLKENHLGNKVLFTYTCNNCKGVFPSFFRDSKTVCPHCNNFSAQLPDTQNGASEKQLIDIYNLFDLYVQYSIAEGEGMPQIEGAACGVPIMAVNYSAMEAVLKDVGGIPIRVDRFFRDPDTSSWRALPSEEDFVLNLVKFLKLGRKNKEGLGRLSRNKVSSKYNWNGIAKVWEKHLDNLPLQDLKKTWESPPRIIKGNPPQPPENLSNASFVRWALININGGNLLNSYTEMAMINDLKLGKSIQAQGSLYFNEMSLLSNRQPFALFDKQKLIDKLMGMREVQNKYEGWRSGATPWPRPSYVLKKG